LDEQGEHEQTSSRLSGVVFVLDDGQFVGAVLHLHYGVTVFQEETHRDELRVGVPVDVRHQFGDDRTCDVVVP